MIDVNLGLVDFVSMINIFVNVFFVYLFVLLVFFVLCKFGGNFFLGVVLGMLMVYFDFLNGWGFGSVFVFGIVLIWNIFGFEIEKVGY